MCYNIIPHNKVIISCNSGPIDCNKIGTNLHPLVLNWIFSLLKERPILGDHPKAHIHEIRQISCEIHPKPYKIRCFNKNSSVWGVQGGGYDPGFHEIWGHSPSPAFIKLNSFGWIICFYKVLGGFHVDFMSNRKTTCKEL